MRWIVVFSIATLSFVTAKGAIASCSTSTQVTGSPLITLVSGKTVCAQASGDKWQEEHQVSGELWDFKKGPSDPIDPSKKVGTWFFDDASNPTTITYQYGTSGPSYTYTVHDDGNGNGNGPYSFCSAGSVTVSGATFQSSADCGF